MSDLFDDYSDEDLSRDEFESNVMQECLAICACGNSWMVACHNGQPEEAVFCADCGELGEL